MALELLAPAKLNLTLEILGRRADGYHEIASLMQTIDLADGLRLSEAPSLDVQICGTEVSGLPADPTRNLAYRAAEALAQAAGRPGLGARIEIEKRIPAGMGLGGGSSDAAAALRGLNKLWGLDMDIEALSRVAASVGSDVTFFLHGGTALVTGRGETVEPLPDVAPLALTLFICDLEIEDKTRRMYATIGPSDFSDGARTRSACDAVRSGHPLAAAELCNAFDGHVSEAAPAVSEATARFRDAGLTVVTAGSGPAFFSLTPLPHPSPLPEGEGTFRPALLDVRRWGVRAIACRSLSRGEAQAMREV